MNVFVLSTGRCGSTTIVHACSHMTNFTAAHESNIGALGDARVSYPQNHIESDNRLSWFLGRLERAFGDDAFYVHLMRDRMAVARSYSGRIQPDGIVRAYARGIYGNLPAETPLIKVCLDYYDTVNANIAAFLANKTKKMNFRLEEARSDFPILWSRIGAEGNLEAALREWNTAYNATLTETDQV